MTADEFYQLWINQSAAVADNYYPKGEQFKPVSSNTRRGEYLRDQGVLFVKVLAALQSEGVIEADLCARGGTVYALA